MTHSFLTEGNSSGSSGHGGWPKMAVMGTTPHVTKCENCGRAGLHKTVVCVVLDSTGAHTSEYHYFGSDCASKIVGKSEKDVEKDADDGDRRRGVRMPKPLKPSPGQLSLGLQYSCGSDWVKERFAAQYFATVSQYGKKPRYEPGQGMLFGGQETAGRQAPLFGEHGRWNEQEHPRASAGQSTGGQFVSKEEAIQQGVEHATKQGAKTGAQAAIHGLEHYSKLPDSAKAHFAGSVNYQDEVGRAFHKKQWSGEDPPEISHEKPLFEFHGEDGMIGRVYKSHDGQYIANLHDSEAERTIQHATKTPDLEQAKALARKFAGVKDEPEKLAAADLPSKSTGKSPKDMDLKELYAKRDEYTRNRKESFENERSKLALEMEAALKKLRRIKPDSPNRKQAEDKIREIKEKQSDWAERINDGSYRETEPHHAEINRRFKEKSDSLRQSTNLTGGAPAAAQGQPEKQGVESVKSDPTENKPTSQSGLFSDIPAPAPKPAKPAPVDNTGGRQDALFAGLNAKPGQMNLFDDAGVPDDLLGKKDKFSAIGDFSDFDVFRYAKPRHSPGQLNLFGDSETSGQQGRLFGDFGITPKNPTGSSTIEPVSKPATEAKPHVNFGPLFSQPKPAAEKPSEKPADSPIPPSPPPLAAPKPATVKASTESKPVHSGHSGHTGGLFDESAHPRWQKGDHEHHGGQFAPKGEVSKSTEEPKPEEKPEVSDQSELPAKESSTALVRHAIDRPKHSIFSGVPEETKYISNTKSISVNALKGADAIWHHQGDPRQTIFNAGQRDAHEHTLRQAKEIEAAQNAGYRLVNHRAGKYGTLYVFEKDGRILTERGAKALVEGTGIVDIPDLGDNMKHRHEAVKQLANFIDSLPESTRNDLGALVNALNRSPLGQHLKISRDDHGMLRLEPKGQRRWYLFEPSTGHDEDGNFHQNLESSLPRFLETIQNMASREIPEGEGGWATHERESKPIVKANGSSPEPAKEALGSDDSSFPSLEGKSSQFAFFDPARHGGVNAMLQLADDVDSGKLSVEDFKAAHALYHENKDAFIEDLGKRLNADQMKKMATRLGSYHANGSKKGENAKYIHERLMGHVFDIGEGISNSYSHSQMMDVNETGRRLAAHVAKQTPESLASHVESVKAKREGQAKQVTELEERLANPKTVNDWTDLSAKLGGYDKLSTEQKIGFDDAIARDRRERDGKEKATVKPVTGTAGQPGKFTTGIVEGHHQKHNKPTFTVTVDERMGEDAYREALGKARALGGNYVNAKVARMYRATPGFQFFDRSAAEQFEKTLKGETVDRSERLQQSRDEMLAKMSEKLAAAGMLKQESGEEAASAGRKENTRRQSEQAANARAQANRQAAFGKTLQRIGEHLASGKSVHLNGIRHGTHVEALDNALRDGKYQLSKGDRGGMSYPGTAKVFSPERIVGTKIESPKDLVQVAQMYRDPRYETLRYFMVKDGVVVGHNAYTSKHVSAVGMKNASERIANDCKAVGADSFYLLHNHPSGNPTPSREDHEYTQNIMEGVKMRSILSNSAPPKFMGHVIIDHNKAAIIPPDESRTHYEISVPNEDLMKTDSEYLGQEITNPDALAKIATANRPEKGRVTVIVCDTKLKTRAILDVALSNLKRPSHHVAGAIRRMTREFGGNMVFGVLPDGSSDSLSHHIKEGVFLDVFDGSGRSQRQNIPDYFPIKHLWNSKNIKTFETARERLSSSHWSDTSRYSDWSPQTTRTGRRAWRNVTTGEVRYQDKEPESAQAKIQRPTPPKGVNPHPGVPAQAQQAARPPAPAAAPKPVRATVGSLKPSHEVFMLPGKEAGFGGKPGPMKAGESAYFMGRSKFGGGFIRLQLKNGQEVHLHSSRFGVKKKSLQDPKPSPLEKGRAKAPAIHDIHAHDFASQKHGILVKSGKDGRGYLYHGGALYRLNDNEYGGGKLKASPMKVRERIHRDAVRLHMLNGGKMSPGNAEFYGDRLNDKSRAPKEWNPVKLAPPGSKPAAKPAATGLKPPTAPAQAVKPSPVVAAPPADPAAVTPTQPDPSPAPAASPAPPRAPDPNMTEFQKATGLMPSAEQSWKDGIEAMKARRRTSDARMEPTGSPTTSAQPAAQATASIPSTTHELKHPTLGSNQRMKRWYNAGRSSGSQEFSSPAQMALYDYGANESYKMRGGRNKTGDRAVRSIDSHQLASQLGIPHEKLYELAMRVHNDVRQQMRGFKDGEHRMLKPTSLVDAPAAPAAAPVAPAARANPSPAPVKPAGPSNRELSKINQVIEKQKSGEAWADEGKDKLLHAIRESFPSDNPNLLANIASDVKHFHKKHMEDVDSHNSAWHSVMNQSGMPKDRRFRSFRELKSAIAKGADSQSAGVKGFDEILQTAKSSYPWIFRGDEGEHESQLLDFMLDGPKEKNPVHHSDVISKFWDSRQPDYHDHVNEINEGNAKHQWWEPDSWYTPESFKTGEGSDWGTPFSAESDSLVERFAAVFHRRRSFPRGHFSRSGYNFASTN